MKREETLRLETALYEYSKERHVYGCTEVTIGFFNNGHGDERVDFMTMDPKGIIRCYEIKVSKQDLSSKAKKSFYGHYNYLVVTEDLYRQISDWSDYISKDIGIIVWECPWLPLVIERKPKKCDIPAKTEIMLKESLIRSLYWKMTKLEEAAALQG